MKLKHKIIPLKRYPLNGKHQECVFDIPYFRITKGEDGFVYKDNSGKPKTYNLTKKLESRTQTDKRWVVYLQGENIPDGLVDLAEIRSSLDLDKLLNYARRTYNKFLISEQKRLKTLLIAEQDEQ